MSDNPNGKPPAVIPGHHSGTLRPLRDSAAAEALARRRWDKRTAAARAGLRDAATELTQKAGLRLPDGAELKTEFDVVRVLTTAHALNASDPSARSSVQSLNAVDRMAFPAPSPNALAGGPPAGGLQLIANLSPEAARELLDAMRALQASKAGG